MEVVLVDVVLVDVVDVEEVGDAEVVDADRSPPGEPSGSLQAAANSAGTRSRRRTRTLDFTRPCSRYGLAGTGTRGRPRVDPDGEGERMSGNRVALIANAGGYVGPPLARLLAADRHDLVLGRPGEGLVDECAAHGVTVLGVHDLPPEHDPGHAAALVAATMGRFGRIDAASTFTGRILGGWFLDGATTEQLDTLTKGIINAPFEFLHAVAPIMVNQGQGQILILTSATAARPTPRAPLYSALRAGADHLVRNVAAEVAAHGVQVNAIGTNYMDFPQYWAAVGGETPERRAALEKQIPLGRMGKLDELAHLCKVFLDGRVGFATGQTIQFDGGWSV